MCECGTFHTFFWRTDKPRARKEYRCGECKRTIPVGTKHVYACGVTQGDTDYRPRFWSFRMCIQCEKDWDKITDIFYTAERESCICYGELAEVIDRAVDLGYLEEDDPLVLAWARYAENSDPRQLALSTS